MPVPMSKEHRISKTVNGGVYFALPPIGDIEMKVMETFQGVEGIPKDDFDYLADAYDEAKAEIEKTSKPPDKANKHKQAAHQKMISAKMVEIIKAKKQKDIAEIAESQMSVVAGADMTNKVMDIVLVDWDHSKSTIEYLRNMEFPKDGKPSQYLPMGVKSVLLNWYQTQFQLTVDESKN